MRNSHSPPCADPNLCYDGLIKQCVTCVNRSGQATSPGPACAPPDWCFDRLIKQCLSCKMMERGAGKAARTTRTCAQPRLCYDRLIKQCVDCVKLHRGTQETTATTDQDPQVPAARITGQGGSAFIFGVYALVGLVLAIAAVLWFVTLKHKRRQRRRPAAKENYEENENGIISSGHRVHKSPNLLGNNGPVLFTCPYSNGTAKTAREGILERNVHCMTVAGSDVVEATSESSCDETCTHSFPLPATELGATVLVTTKTA